MLSLEDIGWSEFFIGGDDGVFNISSSSSGIDRNKLNYDSRVDFYKTPYITRTDISNGVNLFIPEKQDEKYKSNAGGVITIGLDTQTVFYQPHRFYTGQNIQVLKNPNINKYTASFIIPLLKIQMEKFNWGGNGATLGRLNRTKIVLPVDNNEKPDWQYMEKYSKRLVTKKIERYLEYSDRELARLKYKKITPLKEKTWSEFFIDQIVKVMPGRRLTKANMVVGKTPFIGSTDSNNGITNFVSNDNNSKDKNILGVNYNGSVVENFYHPYTAIFSDDVKRLRFKHIDGNKFLYLFLKNCILQQKNKYQYAYKFNERRLRRQKIMLPVNDNGQPDYEYMSQYIMNLEYMKRKKYLEYVKAKKSA